MTRPDPRRDVQPPPMWLDVLMLLGATAVLTTLVTVALEVLT